ncbi:hypothetical protein NE237_021416 [Protea cynaroides]|uniref:Uncharacterized protein n=1 Tax=Protea cynaroides TaxID=273540 RepID=A0A9Q0H7T2_9MAGN|nr:hypothetical protein NE237_021416 [Protea cynaroides]
MRRRFECSRTKRNKELRFIEIKPWVFTVPIWKADDWATQGGKVKTDSTHAPFVTSHKDFDINHRRIGTPTRDRRPTLSKVKSVSWGVQMVGCGFGSPGLRCGGGAINGEDRVR